MCHTEENTKPELEQIATLQSFHLPRWEELPDFDLYMDQLITLIKNYLHPLCLDESNLITSSMVNNYVKLNIIPKPTKKRYQRIHLAYLIAITLLKQVLTISEIRDGIDLQANICGLKEAYNMFCEEQENAIHKTAQILIGDSNAVLEIQNFQSNNAAMKLSTLSLATNFITRILLMYKKKELE